MQNKTINYIEENAIMCEKVKVLLNEITNILTESGNDGAALVSQSFNLMIFANIAIDYIHNAEISAQRLSDEYYNSGGEA